MRRSHMETRTIYILYSLRNSICCGSKGQIVKSRENGFLTQNCTNEGCQKFGEPASLSFSDLPVMRCRQCQKTMTTYINPRKNYAYHCADCRRRVVLADKVGFWSDYGFKDHGFAIPNVDYEAPSVTPKQNHLTDFDF